VAITIVKDEQPRLRPLPLTLRPLDPLGDRQLFLLGRRPQLHYCAALGHLAGHGRRVAVGQADPLHAAGKVAAIAVGELDGQLRLADAADAGGDDDRRAGRGVEQVAGQLAQFVLAAGEEGVGIVGDAGAGGQVTAGVGQRRAAVLVQRRQGFARGCAANGLPAVLQLGEEIDDDVVELAGEVDVANGGPPGGYLRQGRAHLRQFARQMGQRLVLPHLNGRARKADDGVERGRELGDLAPRVVLQLAESAGLVGPADVLGRLGLQDGRVAGAVGALEGIDDALVAKEGQDGFGLEDAPLDQGVAEEGREIAGGGAVGQPQALADAHGRL